MDSPFVTRLLALWALLALVPTPIGAGVTWTFYYKPTKTYTGKVLMHMMPWFETPATSGTGQWGQHWTMATQNPDIIDPVTGRRQIATYYYPEIGPYGSSDSDVIDYQLLLMKYAGVDAVAIDWPGTLNVYDYAKNLQNVNAIIAGIQRAGLDYCIVYEDNNNAIAYNAGFITDKYAAAQADMRYLRDNYFTQSNYVRVNNTPLLLDFGPQAFTSPSDWATIFGAVFNTTKSPPPAFVTLWYQQQQAAPYSVGEFAWIYTDGQAGLANFYQNRRSALKIAIGGVYPGFNTFYTAGGWGGPTWTLPYGTDGSSFAADLDLALQNNAQFIQFNTWNDYGEGTMIEPTLDFNTTFLELMQQKLGVPYTASELDLIKTLYLKRKANAGNSTALSTLGQVWQALNQLNVTGATTLLNGVQ